MFAMLPGFLKGCLTILAILVNTLFWGFLISFLAVFKLTLPFKGFLKIINKIMNGMAENWIGFNNLTFDLFAPVRYHITGMPETSRKKWYLVISNHQSWVDILVLQRVFYRKIPFLKFFAKQQLLYLPLFGFVWWALDYPFMKRYSLKKLKNNPHLKGKDIEATRKACEKFKYIPVSIMNFVEGTRFTPQKKEKTKSTFEGLLKPKAGGIAFVLNIMGEKMTDILDVTIVYPEGAVTVWEYLCGKTKDIIVEVKPRAVSEDLKGDYMENREFRTYFQKWLNEIWVEKDEDIIRIKKDYKQRKGLNS